jgi:hypothetical protein
MGVVMVVGSVLGMVEGIVLVVSKQWLKWQ